LREAFRTSARIDTSKFDADVIAFLKATSLKLKRIAY